jgi:hypothetical protein
MNAEENALADAWWRTVLRDEHFWIPLIVLMGGLLLLRWIT